MGGGSGKDEGGGGKVRQMLVLITKFKIYYIQTEFNKSIKHTCVYSEVANTIF